MKYCDVLLCQWLRKQCLLRAASEPAEPCNSKLVKCTCRGTFCFCPMIPLCDGTASLHDASITHIAHACHSISLAQQPTSRNSSSEPPNVALISTLIAGRYLCSIVVTTVSCPAAACSLVARAASLMKLQQGIKWPRVCPMLHLIETEESGILWQSPSYSKGTKLIQARLASWQLRLTAASQRGLQPTLTFNVASTHTESLLQMLPGCCIAGRVTHVSSTSGDLAKVLNALPTKSSAGTPNQSPNLHRFNHRSNVPSGTHSMRQALSHALNALLQDGVG